MCVCGNVVHMRTLINVSVFLLLGFGCDSFRDLAEGLVFGDLVLFDQRNTSITTSHKSKAGNPSIYSPASNEIISDSVELWDTDVCFLHNQAMDTNVRLPNTQKIPLPKLILNPQSPQQNLSLGINPIDNAEPCYPHDNIVSSHSCGEYRRFSVPIGHKLLSIW